MGETAGGHFCQGSGRALIRVAGRVLRVFTSSEPLGEAGGWAVVFTPRAGAAGSRRNYLINQGLC